MTAFEGVTETVNGVPGLEVVPEFIVLFVFVPFVAFKPFDVVMACALRTEITEKSIIEHKIRRLPLIVPNSFYSPV